MSRTTAGARSPSTLWALRVLVAAGLVTSAVIHFQLAPGYQQAAPGGIGQGTLFRIQASVAILSALYVLARGSRPAFLVAALVALSAFAAIILYRYVQLPAIGPIPSMYEPVWFTEKVVTAVVEGIAGVLAIAGYILLSRSGKAKAGSAAPASAR
ncbi:hypothetical protein QFZ40_000659 [Arthrobacter pascens]|jgi:hypothetical protein|uniref:hypothetical protein n=1 Tax=Arthrobacter pascens TaxID=1677 RepID=UPI00278AD76E|nr:hypothetical protein [Arthrobacter pascens]MDQ0632750.1 hypothetical protein [Arthrobacter pascens]